MSENTEPVQLGVIGWPLDVTLSPVMQQAALEESGLDWQYRRIPVAPGDLDAFIRSAHGALRGVNVTTPHKYAVRALCSRTDNLSSVSGAVNTLLFGDGARTRDRCSETPSGNDTVSGFNTDGPGLARALRERAGFSPAGKTVVVLGAGGSAAACAAQMAGCGARKLTIVNRSPENAEALCVMLGKAFPEITLATERPSAGPDRLEAAAGEADLIISCVPTGAAGSFRQIIEHARPAAVFMDLAYSTSPPEMDVTARKAGLKVVPGLEMLLWQGAISFKIFTGLAAPADAMRKALVNAVGEWWLEC